MIEAMILGQTAAELMETLEKEYGDREDSELVEVAVIALVHDGPDDDARTLLHYRFSEAMWTHQMGLIQGCSEALRNGRDWQDVDTDTDEPEEA